VLEADAAPVRLRQKLGLPRLGIAVHRAEFDYPEGFSVHAHAGLNEEDRSGAGQLHGQRRRDHQR
jgi:hypothetical protein